MQRIITIIAIVVALSIMGAGCAKIGEATGKAVKEVKEMPQEFKEGYKKGRTEE